MCRLQRFCCCCSLSFGSKLLTWLHMLYVAGNLLYVLFNKTDADVAQLVVSVVMW